MAISALGDGGLLALLRCMIIVLMVVELCIPILLGCAPLRLASLVVWSFHLALGTVAYDYSVIAVASLALCSPPEQVQQLAWITTSPTARLVALGVALAGCARLALGKARELGSVEHLLVICWLCLLCPALWISADATPPPSLFSPPFPRSPVRGRRE